MKAKEIKEQSDKQLQILIRENKERLKNLRFALSDKQLKNYSDIKKAKKIVAVAKTVLKERVAKTNNKVE